MYNNTGWTYHALGRYEEALALFEQTQAYYQQEGQARWARVATWCIGRTLRSLGRFTEALALQREMLEHGTTLGEEDGYVYEEVGECLLALGQPEAARPYAARAYELLSRDAGLVATDAVRLQRLKEMAES